MTSSRIGRRTFLGLGGAAVALGVAGAPRAPRAQTRAVPLECFVTVALTVAAPLIGIEKGFFKAEGIDLQLREFPSGTTALQTWKTGAGQIILTGDLPGLAYWAQNPGDHRVIAPLERSAGRYGAVVKADIKGPQDLKGRTIATRVGSTGSYFTSRYLKKNNLTPSDVKVINLETNHMVPALDRGDIDGFFIWEPHIAIALKTSGAKVRKLTTAEGYINGYSLMGARPQWLAANRDVVIRYLRALRRSGTEVTRDKELAATLVDKRYGLKPDQFLPYIHLVGWLMAFDKGFYDDFSDQFLWAKETGMIKPEPRLDFREWCYFDGLRALDPALVTPPPAPVG